MEANGEPPLAAAYHWIFDPVATRFATVAPLQNDCDALPVGAAVVVRVTVTSSLVALSHPFTV